MNFTTIGEVIAGNDPFKRRVEYCLYVSAVNVMAEAANVDAHAGRLTYATKVLTGQASIHSAVVAALTNSSLAAEDSADEIPDGDLQFTMNSLFNALAGIGLT